jgi:hypothetical protein
LKYNVKIIAMKNIGLLIVALIFSHAVSAQIQKESFSSSEIPQGWVYENKSSAAKWQFGYTGVMPHSGPTIESEFTTGAVLFNEGGNGESSTDKISLTSPAVDLSGVKEAQIEVTYNLQVEQNQGKFTIEVFDGKAWKQVYVQDTASPKNTGMNEVVLLEVSDFLNDLFQVRFVYDDEGDNVAQGLGIDHYELKEASVVDRNYEESFGVINVLNLPDNVLVLDANEKLSKQEAFSNISEHLQESELSTDSILYNLSEFKNGNIIFRAQEETNVGSYKALKK